jgi:hypothetical protein
MILSITYPGTYDDTADTWSDPTTVTLSGSAIEITPSSKESEAYRAATLTAERHKLLLFAADTYGDAPVKGMTCEWGGVTYTVAALLGPTAPDGVAILSRLVLVA